MSLETDIQTAYEEQEAVETAARELEARIRTSNSFEGENMLKVPQGASYL